MRPGRELDTAIAQLIFNHEVFIQKKIPWEKTPNGERPLRKYTREIDAAWEIVEKMGITLIPIEGDQWFAIVGQGERWNGPAEFINFLQKGDFANSGAAVGETAPMTICVAAIKAVSTRQEVESQTQQQEQQQQVQEEQVIAEENDTNDTKEGRLELLTQANQEQESNGRMATKPGTDLLQ